MVPAKKDQDIVVQIVINFDGLDVDVSRLRKLVKTVCARFKISKATVSIAIVGNGEIRRVNRHFLNRNSTTDCLSFNLSDDQNREGSPESSRSPKLFELVVNGEMAVKEANARGHSSEAEVALYITHGLLHNLGFDDATTQKAKKMHHTEDEILQQLGYGLVYNKGKRG